MELVPFGIRDTAYTLDCFGLLRSHAAKKKKNGCQNSIAKYLANYYFAELEQL